MSNPYDVPYEGKISPTGSEDGVYTVYNVENRLKTSVRLKKNSRVRTHPYSIALNRRRKKVKTTIQRVDAVENQSRKLD